MKVRWFFPPLMVLLAMGVANCASKPVVQSKTTQYGRLAIVAAPSQGADPKYAPIIVRDAATNVPEFLGFLQKVDCLPDVQLDRRTSPPRVLLDNPEAYDAVAILEYYYPGDMIFMDIILIDTKTWQKIWSFRLDVKKDDIQRRLEHMARIAPHRIGKHYYRD